MMQLPRLVQNYPSHCEELGLWPELLKWAQHSYLQKCEELYPPSLLEMLDEKLQNFLCACSGTFIRDIRAYLQENPSKNLLQFQEEHSVGIDCSLCFPGFSNIFEQEKRAMKEQSFQRYLIHGKTPVEQLHKLKPYLGPALDLLREIRSPDELCFLPSDEISWEDLKRMLLMQTGIDWRFTFFS